MEVFSARKEESKPITEIKSDTGHLSNEGQKIIVKDSKELQFFECVLCNCREKYEYFGKTPPFLKCFVLLEDAYVIEDPFIPPKQGENLVLGSHCIMCNNIVCKDTNCSLYYNGTFCINCAKEHIKNFPKVVQEKLNKIVK